MAFALLTGKPHSKSKGGLRPASRRELLMRQPHSGVRVYITKFGPFFLAVHAFLLLCLVRKQSFNQSSLENVAGSLADSLRESRIENSQSDYQRPQRWIADWLAKLGVETGF